MSRKRRPESGESYVPDESAGSTRGLNLTKMRRASFPELKPSSSTISLRIPTWMLHDLKRLANQQDVPYQSFIKMILTERLAHESRKRSA